MISPVTCDLLIVLEYVGKLRGDKKESSRFSVQFDLLLRILKNSIRLKHISYISQ